MIAHHDDAGRAIVEHVERQGDALLVMATSAKASFTAQFLGGVTEDVLGLINRPVLLIGPRVPPDIELGDPTLVACIERGDVAEAAVPAITSWMRTFGGSDPWLAELTAPPAESTEQPSLVEPFVILLAAEGIRGVPTQLHGDDAESWLDDLDDRVANSILVSTSVRWTDKHARGRSTTRRLVQRSTRPVLVVPARYAPWRTHPAPPSSHELPLDAIEELTPAACWRVLGAAQVGRLAVCTDGSPHIFPINYVVDEQTIVFRTAPGSKLAASTNTDVAFEVDEFDVDSGQACSVIIEGRASEITEAADWDRALGLPLFPWHVTPKGHFVRITPNTVSGRRFRAAYAGRRGQR